MFSSRVPGVLNLNRLSSAVAAHRAAGRQVVDLTVTNPTAVGISYDAEILAPLSDAGGTRYQPEPFGMVTARTAVAADYARRGISVAEDRIVLTASTSEAYSLLFKLLCAPSGDEVLVPAPSYPLFDHLTQLDGVNSRQYALEYHGRWELDVDSVDRAWSARTRAVLAVSPNNPTGSMLAAIEFGALASRCAERDAALIVDEVFADYAFAGSAGSDGSDGSNDAGELAGQRDCLSFHLGGLSKSAGLPQVKLGWIRVDGPDRLVAEACDRLELIGDTYLSVSTPVQVAAPALIESGAKIRRQIQDRIRINHAALQAAVAACPSVELLAADAGWSAVLRVPSRWSEEDLVIALLRDRDVLVHPGFFFDFAHEAFLVLSLLPDPAVFADGVTRVMEHVGG
ncbi:MAG TPA: pyridoxal phosphate-dependent aminotransferase [Vicinamibacterales bacterium]|nr:pyridoxal phosphate-dependent aminotransferase [Vicinamibacterales bacterium]